MCIQEVKDKGSRGPLSRPESYDSGSWLCRLRLLYEVTNETNEKFYEVTNDDVNGDATCRAGYIHN